MLFAIPRVSGWLAQYVENVLDEEQKITRPRQIYLGEELRTYQSIDTRPKPQTLEQKMLAGRL